MAIEETGATMSDPAGITILGTAGSVVDSPRLTTAQRLKIAGNNTGNLVFQYAVTRLLAPKKTYIPTATMPAFDADAVAGSRYLVFPAANHLRPGADWRNLNKLLRDVDLPLVILGLGAQAPSSNDPQAIDQILKDSQVRMLADIIRERAVLVTARGAFSAEVCARLGIETEILGCPSLLINPDPTLGRQLAKALERLQESPRSLRVVMTAAAPFEIAKHAMRRDLEARFFQWTVDRDGLYVQQSGGEEIVALSAGAHRADTLQTAQAVRPIIYPEGTPERFIQHINSRHRIFWNAAEWIAAMRGADIAFGSRLHGNMAALAAGVPALFVPHDARTEELIDTMKLAYLKATDVPDSFEQTINQVEFDGEAFDKNRAMLSVRFKQAMARIGVPVNTTGAG
tara:strand:- start:13941 stop:15137 length:1197 start_codon:yes stop_codon:yes gene_type:complete